MAQTAPTNGRRTARRTDRRTNGRARRRERPLGAAIGLGVAVSLAVALAIFAVLFLLPSSSVHNMYLLAAHNSSPTLRSDPLFVQWMDDIDREEALFVTPLSLLCGGLTLGRLAPAYAGRARVLRSAGLLALGLVAASLAFVWPAAIAQQNGLNRVGGRILNVGIPPDLILRQALWSLLWVSVCVLGAWAGLAWRARATPRPPA